MKSNRLFALLCATAMLVSFTACDSKKAKKYRKLHSRFLYTKRKDCNRIGWDTTQKAGTQRGR